MKTSEPKVEMYRVVAQNGRHVRMATKVTFADGEVVRFGERLGKAEAVRQARLVRERR